MSNSVLATIDGHHVKIPVDLFNDLALIPKSPYKESYWENNHITSSSFDMSTDNGWAWTVNLSDVGAQVLQIVPNAEIKLIEAAVPAELYNRFMALLEKSDGRKQS
jgi:hypothetical protein